MQVGNALHVLGDLVLVLGTQWSPTVPGRLYQYLPVLHSCSTSLSCLGHIPGTRYQLGADRDKALGCRLDLARPCHWLPPSRQPRARPIAPRHAKGLSFNHPDFHHRTSRPIIPWSYELFTQPHSPLWLLLGPGCFAGLGAVHLVA